LSPRVLDTRAENGCVAMHYDTRLYPGRIDS